MDWTIIKTEAYKLLVNYGPRLILAIIVLFVGFKLVKVTQKLVARAMKKRNTDETAQKFIVDLIGALLKVLVIISVLTMCGVATTSFVAIIGAIGLAVGLALQGTLQNFAGGVLLLIFKPYKLGDFIETQGESGSVKEIQIFTTLLTTPDNKRVIIPNGAIVNGNITNYTEEGMRRVDLQVGVAYSADLKQTKSVILNALLEDTRVLQDPTPIVAVGSLADSSVVFEIRPYTSPEDYWDVYFDTLERVKIALDEAGIGIPFPQTEITIVGKD